jgi:hypothetical protein
MPVTGCFLQKKKNLDHETDFPFGRILSLKFSN